MDGFAVLRNLIHAFFFGDINIRRGSGVLVKFGKSYGPAEIKGEILAVSNVDRSLEGDAMQFR